MRKTGYFWSFLPLYTVFAKLACIPNFSLFLAKQIPKMHKITSYFYGLRKFLTKNFWSQGTPLGYLGAGSRPDVGHGSCRFQILVIWGPNEASVLVACPGQAKSPKTAGAWCGINNQGRESR